MPNHPKLEQLRESVKTEVTGDVSPGLHPDALLPFAQPLIDHEAATPALDSAFRAQQVLYNAMRDMTAAENETRLKYGGTLVVDGKSIQRAIPEAQQAALAADLGARFESTAKRFDRHLGVVNETIDSLTTTIERVLSPKKDTPATAQAASDIRAYVKNLPEEKRMSFLHEAAKSDHEVIAAVLSTTPWVSGLNREQAALVKEMASEGFAPKEHAARAAAQKIAGHLLSSAQNWTAAYRKLVPVLKPSAHAAAIQKLKGPA